MIFIYLSDVVDTAIDHDIREHNGTVKRRKSVKQATSPGKAITTPSGKKIGVKQEKHEVSTSPKPVTPSTGSRTGLRSKITGLLETPDGTLITRIFRLTSDLPTIMYTPRREEKR